METEQRMKDLHTLEQRDAEIRRNLIEFLVANGWNMSETNDRLTRAAMTAAENNNADASVDAMLAHVGLWAICTQIEHELAEREKGTQ